MQDLINYIQKYAQRGECTCGHCFDGVPNPEQHQPSGHTADVHFFKVAAKDWCVSADELKKLVQANVKGSYGDVDLFDKKEHSYIELGGWIGDQGLALTLMGLGSVLGLWELLTPERMFGKTFPKEMLDQMAGAGYITVQSK